MGRKRIRTMEGWLCPEGHDTRIDGIISKKKRLTNGEVATYYSCRACCLEYDRKSRKKRGAA